MKDEYDFSKGKRGVIDPTPAGKTRITIRLDDEIIAWFRQQAEQGLSRRVAATTRPLSIKRCMTISNASR
jgi:hypothetical protein